MSIVLKTELFHSTQSGLVVLVVAMLLLLLTQCVIGRHQFRL